MTHASPTVSTGTGKEKILTDTTPLKVVSFLKEVYYPGI